MHSLIYWFNEQNSGQRRSFRLLWGKLLQ